MWLRTILWLVFASVTASAAAPTRTQVVVGMRQTLFPEKDNTARLTRAARKEASRRRNVQNEELKKRAEGIFKESDVLKQMALFVLPFVHGEPDARSLLEQVRGKARGEDLTADFAILPTPEWESLRKDFTELEAFLYVKSDGRGGDIAVVYEPNRLKQKVAVFDRIDRITETYVEDLLTKKLGLHPGESSEISTRLKREVRQALSSKGGALRSGRDIEKEFVRGLSDSFVKEHLGPELKGKWTGHDPLQTETAAHKPGDRETAGQQDPGHIRKPTAP